MIKPDLSILGGAIKSLPPRHWKERMLFSGIPDTDLRLHTGDFPATLRKDRTTHPVYVLKSLAVGHLVCPCSSKQFRKRQRFIKKGCRLEMSSHVTDRNSYLVERYIFTMPMDGRFSRKYRFRGRVPSSCLAGEEG
jgi:hypothetical protein